ncbi:MAG: hypothetical protein ABR910_14480 [Acidobacteriaceae bacterium]|jgi:fermentation-respiration switch protein FrsA (DUF1100 family)
MTAKLLTTLLAVALATTPAPTQTSSSSDTPAAPYAKPNLQIVIPEDTPLRVLTEQPLTSKRSRTNTPVSFKLSQDLVVGNAIVIPRGAPLHGVIVEDKKAGRLTGTPTLEIKLTSLDLGGQTYPLYAYHLKLHGDSKSPTTEREAVTGAYAGAFAGEVVSARTNQTTAAQQATRIAAGAAAGAAVGAITSAATPSPAIQLPPESEMEFQLAAPISIRTILPSEAAQLAQRLPPGGPTLIVRPTP